MINLHLLWNSHNIGNFYLKSTQNTSLYKLILNFRETWLLSDLASSPSRVLYVAIWPITTTAPFMIFHFFSTGPFFCEALLLLVHSGMQMADGFIGWWLILFLNPRWSYFNHAGNLPAPGGYLSHTSPLNWDPVLLRQRFHKVENGRSRFWDISLPSSPSLPFGKSGCEVDKFLHGAWSDASPPRDTTLHEGK